MKRKLLSILLALCLLFSVLSACSEENSPPKESLKLWYIQGAPASELLYALSNEYPDYRLEVRSFADEESFSEAFNTIRPDLVYCSARQAELLYTNELLIPLEGESIEKAFSEVQYTLPAVESKAFFPLGANVCLMTRDETKLDEGFDSFEALCEYGKGQASLISFESYADTLAVLIEASGESFSGVREKDVKSDAYRYAYNLLAELVAAGGISEQNAICRAVSSESLAEVELINTAVTPLPLLKGTKRDYPADFYGFVCTANQKKCSAFIDYLTGRDVVALSLQNGLLPACAFEADESNALYKALLTLSENYNIIPLDRSCEWLQNKADFDYNTSIMFKSILP